jgi:pimeloyl-ACP methyl ester carboxylesterase
MSASRPTLILLHGATLNDRMWDPVRRGLDPDLRVLTPDLPGHGSRRNEPYTLQAAIDTVVAAAASVAPAPVVVGGDSLGGFTTLASASALPREQLRGLVVSGASANLTGRALWPYKFKIMMNRVLLATLGEKFLLGDRMVRTLVKWGIAEADARALLGAGVHLPAFEQAVHQLADIDFRAKAAALDVPVLVLNGTRDSDMMPQEPAFIAALKHPTVHHFEGAEHGISIREHAGWAAQVNRFIASL